MYRAKKMLLPLAATVWVCVALVSVMPQPVAVYQPTAMIYPPVAHKGDLLVRPHGKYAEADTYAVGKNVSFVNRGDKLSTEYFTIIVSK